MSIESPTHGRGAAPPASERAQPALEVLHEAERAHSLLHPARLQLLAALDEPGSAVALAERLDLPRQRVNYHLRELEAHGLVEAVEESRRGSVVERTYRRTGRSFALSGAVLGPLDCDPDALDDPSTSAHQIAVAARVVRELGRLEQGARAAGSPLPTLTMDTELRFASPRTRARFAQELGAAIAALVGRYHDEEADESLAYRLYLGAYPKPVAAASPVTETGERKRGVEPRTVSSN